MVLPNRGSCGCSAVAELTPSQRTCAEGRHAPSWPPSQSWRSPGSSDEGEGSKTTGWWGQRSTGEQMAGSSGCSYNARSSQAHNPPQQQQQQLCQKQTTPSQELKGRQRTWDLVRRRRMARVLRTRRSRGTYFCGAGQQGGSVQSGGQACVDAAGQLQSHTRLKERKRHWRRCCAACCEACQGELQLRAGCHCRCTCRDGLRDSRHVPAACARAPLACCSLSSQSRAAPSCPEHGAPHCDTHMLLHMLWCYAAAAQHQCRLLLPCYCRGSSMLLQAAAAPTRRLQRTVCHAVPAAAELAVAPGAPLLPLNAAAGPWHSMPCSVSSARSMHVATFPPPSQRHHGTAAAAGRPWPALTLPLYASRRASRCFWLTTVSTRAMPLRTTLLQAGKEGSSKSQVRKLHASALLHTRTRCLLQQLAAPGLPRDRPGSAQLRPRRETPPSAAARLCAAAPRVICKLRQPPPKVCHLLLLTSWTACWGRRR